jgi:formate dehydrogenase major subunit
VGHPQAARRGPQRPAGPDAILWRRWPLLRQILAGGDGTGPEAMSDATRSLRPKTDRAEAARSICPYCGVGCGQLVFHRQGRLIAIDGDRDRPSRPAICARRAPRASSCSPTPAAPRRSGTVPRAPPRGRISISRRPWTCWWIASGSRGSGPSRRSATAVPEYRAPGRSNARQRRELSHQHTFTGGLGIVCVSNQARI